MMLRTKEVAARIGVHPETLKRWIRKGKIPSPNRDRNGWYIFDEQDLKNAMEYANKIHIPEHKQPNLWSHMEETP